MNNLNFPIGANIEIENKDGWRCMELRQHKTIEQVNFLLSFDEI